MTQLMNIKNRYVLFLLYVVALSLYIFAWFVTENSGRITLVKIAAFTVSAVLYSLCHVNIRDRIVHGQMVIINILLIVFHLLLAIVSVRYVISARYYSEMCLLSVWLFIPVVLTIRDLIVKKDSLYDYIKYVSDNKVLVVGALMIAIVAIVCSYDIDGPHFVWDSNLAYNKLFRDINIKSLFVPTDMRVSYHISLSYFYPIALFSALFNSIKWGFFFYNACCILIATFGFAFFIRSVFPQCRSIVVVFSTTICMISPYLFGLSTLYFCDYAAICFTPMLLLFAYKKRWLLFFCIGLFCSFIKEPCIVYYAGICFAVLLWELLADRVKITDIIKDTKYYLMALPGVIFSVLFLSFGYYFTEPHVESVGLRAFHVQNILKVFCVLNYSWVLVILSLTFICLSALRYKTNMELFRAMLLISISAGAFLALNFAIVSPANPRYTDSFFPSILIMSVCLILLLGKTDMIRCGGLLLLGLLFVIADFSSTDPVSKSMFNSINIGETSLFSTVGAIADPSVYNRQYYGMDLAVSEAMSHADFGSNERIFISTGNTDDCWPMSGKWDFGFHDGVFEFDELWDKHKNERAPGYSWKYDEERYMPIKVGYIFPEQDHVEELNIGESFIYIYMPTQNEGREDAIRDTYEIYEDKTITRRGFTIGYLKGR